MPNGKREQLLVGADGVLSVFGIEIRPASVIDGDLHFLRVAVVHILAAAVVVSSVVVLRIIDVRIMVHPVPVLGVVSMPPLPAISLLSLGLIGTDDKHREDENHKQKYDPTGHGKFPPCWLKEPLAHRCRESGSFWQLLRPYESVNSLAEENFRLARPLAVYLDHRQLLPPALREYSAQQA
jgi:hypothetical protein